MPLIDQFENSLRPPGLGGRVVGVIDGGDSIELGVDQDDRLAVAFWNFELRSDRLHAADADRVRQVAEAITKRVVYLLEPLTPCELDALSCVVQLRSAEPELDADSRAYYEVLVTTGGAVTLSRYRKSPGALRERVPATLTKQVLVRFARDVLDSLA